MRTEQKAEQPGQAVLAVLNFPLSRGLIESAEWRRACEIVGNTLETERLHGSNPNLLREAIHDDFIA